MPSEADRFRVRARECRELAKLTNSEFYRNTLNRLAEHLEAEADAADNKEPREPTGAPEKSE